MEGTLEQINGRWTLTVTAGAQFSQAYPAGTECPAWLHKALVASVKRKLRRLIDEDSWADRVQTVG